MTGAEFSGVDVDLLADYVGGALDGTPDEAAVTALIADDPAWRTAHDELTLSMAAVGVRLNALGATNEPMPTELAARLDAAFLSATLTAAAPSTGTADLPVADTAVAANHAADGTEGNGAARSPGVDAVADPSAIDPELAAPTVPHLVKSERHLSVVPGDGVGVGAGATAARRRLRWAAPVAAAAGVIAFVGVGIGYLNASSPSANDSATSTAARSEAGGSSDQGGAPLSAPGAAPAAGGAVFIASGTDYRSGTLADEGTARAFAQPESTQAAPDVSGATSDALASQFPPAVPFGLARLTTPVTMQACLDAIEALNNSGPITVQSIDFARYQGSPALVVRFHASNGEWTWASGPDCGLPGVGAAKLATVKVG